METIETIFAKQPISQTFRVTFKDGQVYILTDVMRGQDPGAPAHVVATVVQVVKGSAVFAEGPQGAAMFFQVPEVAEVRDAVTDSVLFVA